MEYIEDNLVPDNPEHDPFAQTFFHGTKADLEIGDYIHPGHQCNYMGK